MRVPVRVKLRPWVEIVNERRRAGRVAPWVAIENARRVRKGYAGT